MANDQLTEDHAALAAAGWLRRSDVVGRRERPDAPYYDDTTVQGIRSAAERLRTPCSVERGRPARIVVPVMKQEAWKIEPIVNDALQPDEVVLVSREGLTAGGRIAELMANERRSRRHQRGVEAMVEATYDLALGVADMADGDVVSATNRFVRAVDRQAGHEQEIKREVDLLMRLGWLPADAARASVLALSEREAQTIIAKHAPDADLTNTAETSPRVMFREVARAELLARIEARRPRVEDIRDEWDNLPDAEPSGIVQRR